LEKNDVRYKNVKVLHYGGTGYRGWIHKTFLRIKHVLTGIFGNTLFRYSTLDILQTISNFSTTYQLTVSRVLVDCQLNI